MEFSKKTISLKSLAETIVGMLFVPEGIGPFPGLVICHGAGEFKEDYIEMCGYLAAKGIASVALDMHGHGESQGIRYRVDMKEWVPDVKAAISFLSDHPKIDSNTIGVFGLSSGGTAILEAAVIDQRIKKVVALDSTVRDSLPALSSLALKILTYVGVLKRMITGSDLRISLFKLGGNIKLAEDPDIDRKIEQDPRAIDAYSHFPLPGAAQAFFVDTIKRVPQIKAPTLVIWGEKDQLDPPETAKLLYAALTCEKELHIIPGNGHVGHLDRNKEQVFALTAGWMLKH